MKSTNECQETERLFNVCWQKIKSTQTKRSERLKKEVHPYMMVT